MMLPTMTNNEESSTAVTVEETGMSYYIVTQIFQYAVCESLPCMSVLNSALFQNTVSSLHMQCANAVV